MRRINRQNIRNSLKKALAGFLAGVFLFTSTLGWAQEERLFSAGTGNRTFSSGPADDSKLAAELRTTRPDFKELYKAVAISRFIEKEGIFETDGIIYDVSTLKEIVKCLREGNIHPVLALEIERLMNEYPDKEIISNVKEYIPGPFRINEIRNARIVESGENLFVHYKQHVLKRVQTILDLINKKAKDGSLSISEEELEFFNKHFKSAMSSLFNSVQIGNLTHPQFEELLFMLVNMITPSLYDDIKRESNNRGMEIYGSARKEIKNLEQNNGWDEAFKRAIIYAALGNGLEAQYYDKSLLNTAGIDERLINIDGFLKGMLGKIEAERGGTILYFLDNAGEIFLDLLVVELLSERGFNIKLVAKERPTTDDLTVADVEKLLSDLIKSDEKEYQWGKRLEVASSGSRTPATDFNKIKPELFEGAIFSIYKGGGNHYGACPAVLTGDSFHIFMIKEPLQRAILATEGVDKAKNVRGSLVFLHREKGKKAIRFDTLLKDGSVFEPASEAESPENLNGLSLEEIKARLLGIKKSFERIHLTISPHEIIIEIPDEGMAVRYFDPTMVNVITPYSDVSKLQTKVIGPRLNRQIIHRAKALEDYPSRLARNIMATIKMLDEAKQIGQQELVRKLRKDITKLVETADEITRMTYDRMSAKYKQLRGHAPEGRDLQELQKFLNLSGQKKTEGRDIEERVKILDVGTGLRDISWLSDQPSVSAVGIDYAKSVVESIKEERGDVDVRRMNMLNLEFNNEEFDGVRFQATLHHQPIIDLEQGADVAIGKAYRVLKPEGICYVFVKAETDKRRGFMAVDTGEGLGARFYQFYSKESLRQILERNGFHLLGDIEEWTDKRGEKNLIAFARKSNLDENRVSAQFSEKPKDTAILFPHFINESPFSTTLRTILGSLGSFEKRLDIQKLYIREEPEAGYVPFTLSDSGKQFFKELLDLESINGEAYILTWEGDECQRATGSKILPYGILFKDSSNNLFLFDLVEFLTKTGDIYHDYYSVKSIASKCSVLAFHSYGTLFPLLKDRKLKVIYLASEKSPPVPVGIRKDMQEKLQFDGSFDMLVIKDEEKDKDFVFYPNDPRSRDFQECLWEKADSIDGKRVMEIGAGTGINLLLAIKFGARSVIATDISWIYVLLSRWNLEFAQETKQIQKVPEGSVKITHKSGFADEDADLYLFNTPLICSNEEIEDLKTGHRTLRTIGNFILLSDFLNLFAELDRRLSSPDTSAVWRILPSTNSSLTEVNEEDIQTLGGPIFWEKYKDYAKSKAMAKKFLKEAGFETTPFESGLGIYFITKPERSNIGQFSNERNSKKTSLKEKRVSKILLSDKVAVKNQNDYIDKNETLFKDTLGENKIDTLLRVPIEAIESIGVDNIKDFLATFQEAPNGYVELYYMSGIGEVAESIYQKYGLENKTLPKGFIRSRRNTVTLFPALKGEEINQATIVSRLGSVDISPKDTILSPIGLQHDPMGLIRATILGLKIMDLARQIERGHGEYIIEGRVDKDKVQSGILEDVKNLFDQEALKDVNINIGSDDIIALATGNINNIITALKKLIRLLPITPIDAEELRKIYEHVKEVITAA